MGIENYTDAGNIELSPLHTTLEAPNREGADGSGALAACGFALTSQGALSRKRQAG